MSEWQTIDTAPLGPEIQARIPEHGDDNIIAWQWDAFLNSEDRTCGGWAFTREQEPPDSWSGGVCWDVNEDGVASTQPTHWKALAA